MQKRRSRHLRRPVMTVVESLERRQLLAFGVTTTATTYTIDNGGDLKFTVLKNGATTSSTIHLGDITSIKYKNQETLASYAQTSRYSHYEQGLGSTSVISYTVDPNNNWILVKCDDSAATSGAVIQYYAVRKNDNNLYMASLPIDVNNGPGEGRFIGYLSRSVFTTPEAPSDNNGSTGAIEGSDVFGHADGTTTSKFYNMGRRMIENKYHGLVGSSAGISVGAWMFMGNREHSAGGPFFKDIDFQSSSSQVEIYNCIFTGHTQTEPYRQGLHVYSLQFTDGSAPADPDYSWMEPLNLQGWIPAAQRGTLSGKASGVPSGHEVVIGLSNSTAQYWATPDAAGNYAITGIQPGTYTETLYDTELGVGTRTVTISAGVTTRADITNTSYTPSAASTIWRIGTWDGTPLGFLNSDKIEIMHPSDVRMTSWTSTPNFVIGANTDSQWPMVQWKDVNNAQRITFNLTSAQAATALTLRIGITLGFEGGRNQITVNAGQTYAWTSSIPAASTDLNSRGITRGTWRGPNQRYTYNIPTSGLRAGANTIDLPVVAGTPGTTWLSPNVTYDAIDLVTTSSLTNAPVVTSIAVTPANPTVTAGQTRQFTATAFDQFGNPTPANVAWSTTNGTIDNTGLYTAPGTTGGATVTATSGSVSGNTSVTIGTSTNQAPTIATPPSGSPNPANSTSTNLSVLGADDSGEANLTYTWSLIGTPPAPVVFSANGTNAAKNTTATFTTAGTYDFLVTITDAASLSTTASVSVPVSFGAFSESRDIGGPATVGSLSYSSGTYTVKGSGADIWSTADQFRYGYTSFTGNGQMTARFVSETNTSSSAKAGIMFRDSATANAAYAFVWVSPSGQVKFETRAANGVSSVYSALVATTTPVYLQLVRSGANQFSAYCSLSGSAPWVQVGTTQTVTMANSALLGLAVTSHNNGAGVLNTATFSNVSIASTISGKVFHDVNDDGVFNAEPALAGVTVYLDTNDNGTLDAGEATATSDGSGNYTLSGVPAGTYSVRQVNPPDFVATETIAVSVGNGAATGVDLPNERIVYNGTGSADDYLVRMNTDGQYEIVISGSLAYTVFPAAPSLTFNLAGGDDVLTVDAADGYPAPAGGISYDGGSGNDELLVQGTTQSDNATFNGSSVSLGAGAMNHLNLETLSYDGRGGLDSVTVSGGAVVTLQSDLRLEALSIDGPSARIVVPAGRQVLSVNSLHVEGLLDLTDNDLVVNSGSYTTIQQLVLRGFGGGATGVTSSTSDGSQILALFDNGLVGAGEWNGVTIGASAIVGKYTYFGDVNFDGQVTGDDYTIIDSNLNTAPPSGFEWLSGDANLDGMVTGDDYTTIDSNLGLGSGSSTAPASVLSKFKDQQPLTITPTSDLLQ